MKKILFLLATLAVIGCSDNNSEEKTINFSFSKSEMSIAVGTEYDLSLNEIDIEECNIYSEDEFIAEVSSYSGKANISARHTGSTKIIAEYKDKKAECRITVTSLVNYIGNPILDFGASKDEIKIKLKGEILQEASDRIECKEDFKYPIYNTYHFKDDKLECIYSEVNVNTNSINIMNSLLERYKYISSESNVHWFSRPNKFIIRENERGGNGGYAVRYAKDKDTMGKYYQL